MTASDFTDLVVVSPVFEDWEAVGLLLPRLDAALAASGAHARVVLVNDGSTEPVPAGLVGGVFSAIREVRVLSLRRNLGHQRALAIGLAFIHEELPCDAVVVMDADGEDDPPDITRLLAEVRASEGRSIVFARRTRRSEGLTFTFLYKLYRALHRALTGISVQVGNFSVIPYALLGRLVVVSDLWNHYAAAIFQSRIRYTMVPTARARRLSGTSRMNLVLLVAHGLSAIAVFADRVGVRIVLAAIATLLAIVVVAVVAIARSMWMHIGIPGWVIAGAFFGIVLVVQSAAAASLFVLQVLFARVTSTFIPVRDYPFFVQSDEAIWSRVDRSV